MSKWRPIATVPVDQEILIYWKNENEDGIAVCIKSFDYFPVGVYGHDFEVCWEDPGTQITHWMPLPKPPKK